MVSHTIFIICSKFWVCIEECFLLTFSSAIKAHFVSPSWPLRANNKTQFAFLPIFQYFLQESSIEPVSKLSEYYSGTFSANWLFKEPILTHFVNDFSLVFEYFSFFVTPEKVRAVNIYQFSLHFYLINWNCSLNIVVMGISIVALLAIHSEFHQTVSWEIHLNLSF